MKININYDLLSKIKQAKLGFSLQKCAKMVFIISSIQTVMYTSLNVLSGNSMFDGMISGIPVCALFNVLMAKLVRKISQQRVKSQALNKVIDLSILLRNIDVNTDYELLQQSRVYSIKYKFDGFDENLLPRIKQEKYIMVPTYSNRKQKEVSLVQEHVIGSSEYSISHGTPKKVLKLTSNSISKSMNKFI